MILQVQYDDGFIAYINGVKVAERNAPGTLAWNSSATAEHPASQAIVREEIDISSFVSVLQQGRNVLAIHGLNLNAGDNDFLLQPRLIVSSEDPFTRYFGYPTFNALNDFSLSVLQ